MTAVRVRDLPLRTKIVMTLVGAAMILLGLSSYLSFRYWKQEALQAAGQEALLGASSARAAVESALMYGHQEQVRANLKRLAESTHVREVRVFAPDDTIVFSPDASEEGRRVPGVWLPTPRELPERGLFTSTPDGTAVRAFLPAGAPRPAIIEVEFSVAPLKAALDRGARFGIALLIGSLFAFVAILFLLLEREVVAPLGRVARAAAKAAGVQVGQREELRSLAASVAGLIEQEEESRRLAQAQRERLAQQAGLAQVGEMAAEMAHEFKRPLASVRTAIELLREGYVPDARGQELLARVDEQLERLTETMRDLFALARPEALELERVDVRDLVDDALLQLAGHPQSEAVTLTKDFAADALELRGDRRRLVQAMVNLMGNALEAMPEGGELTLRSRRVAGGTELSVEDTGAGIPPEEVERVLRPFYSTKELGTGLGLPLVARIIAAHQGRLFIDGLPGQGTTIRVVLPQAPGANAEEAEWRTPESSSLTTIG
ncbi:MAG TPA: ATP-binding protein [Longimicrobiales bacterium]